MKTNMLSEEKKQDIREKNKIRMQKYRANLSDEDRADLNQRVRQRRQNLPEEEKSMQKYKDALQHRNKYHEEKKSLVQQSHHLNKTRDEDKNGDDRRERESDVDEDEDEDEDEDKDKDEDEVEVEVEVEDNDNHAAADRLNALQLRRQNRNEKIETTRKRNTSNLKMQTNSCKPFQKVIRLVTTMSSSYNCLQIEDCKF